MITADSQTRAKHLSYARLDHLASAEPQKSAVPAQPTHRIMRNNKYLLFQFTKLVGGLFGRSYLIQFAFLFVQTVFISSPFEMETASVSESD